MWGLYGYTTAAMHVNEYTLPLTPYAHPHNNNAHNPTPILLPGETSKPPELTSKGEKERNPTRKGPETCQTPKLPPYPQRGGGKQGGGNASLQTEEMQTTTIPPAREVGVCSCPAWPQLYDHRPSHPYNAGTDRVEFFTDQTDIACTKRKAPRGANTYPWKEKNA